MGGAGSTNAYCRLADGTEITEATLGRVAWFDENLSTRPRWLSRFLDFAERVVDRVHEVDWSETLSHKPVERKEPNAWGLHDLHGNVWEWTETADGVHRVHRGGSWFSSARACESSYRNWNSPVSRGDNLGFRLCATQSPAAEETHAESAEFESHAESAEFESHAESAEDAEP